MKKSALLLIFILTLAFCLIACNGGAGDTATTTEEITSNMADITTVEVTTAEETTAEEITTEEATTEEITTEAPTEAPTEEATTEEETTAGDPVTTLVKVGKSYDGKTDCYDGRFNFEVDEWAIFKTKYGEYYSIQEAIDDLEGEGGNISMETYGDLGLCLSAIFPDDGCDYHIYYNFNNCDFVFNMGLTYDDDNDPHGYCYYSNLELFDGMNRENLDGHHIFIWETLEGFAPGYYELEYIGNGGATGGLNYNYNRLGSLEEYWPGLPDGETYFDS